MAKYKDPQGYIEINGLRVYANHGVSPQEKAVGNVFEISVKLYFACEHAMRTDRIDLTVNYADVIELIKSEMRYPCQLLEHAAFRLYESMTRRYSSVYGGEIKLYKLQPPVSAEVAAVGFTFTW